MNAQIEKLELVRLLLDTDDKEILKAVKSLLKPKRNKKVDETTYLMSSEANKNIY